MAREMQDEAERPLNQEQTRVPSAWLFRGPSTGACPQCQCLFVWSFYRTEGLEISAVSWAIDGWTAAMDWDGLLPFCPHGLVCRCETRSQGQRESKALQAHNATSTEADCNLFFFNLDTIFCLVLSSWLCVFSSGSNVHTKKSLSPLLHHSVH